jgi:hypothetical protein
MSNHQRNERQMLLRAKRPKPLHRFHSCRRLVDATEPIRFKRAKRRQRLLVDTKYNIVTADRRVGKVTIQFRL